MAKMKFKASPTSVILRVKLMDSTSTSGAGKTGLTNTSSGLIISTIKIGESSATVYAAGSSNIETITTLGTYAAPSSGKCRFKEVDATNHPGIYELQFADSRFASTTQLLISISGAAGLAQFDTEIDMTEADVNVTSWKGSAVPTPTIAGVPDINLFRLNGADPTQNLATLKLKSLDIQNDNGSAFIAKSTGGNGKGMDVAGHGTGHGANFQGGATAGDGIRSTGGDNGYGTAAGNALNLVGSTTAGAGVSSGQGSAIKLTCQSQQGASVHARDTGSSSTGVDIASNNVAVGLSGGSLFGTLRVQSSVGDAIVAVAAGNGNGINSSGYGSGCGMKLNKGASGKDIDADEIDNIPTAVWSAGTRTLTSFGTLVNDIWSAGTRTLTSFGTLVNDIATAVWNALTSGMSTVGSIGKKLADWVLGSDNKVLISTNAQDLSASLDIRVKAYTTGQDPATLVLDTPANKLVTDANGRVQVQAGSGVGQIQLSSGRVQIQSGTGTGQIDLSSGQVKVQQGTGNGQLDTTSGQVKVQVGTSAGQLDTVSGAVKVADKTGFSLTTGERTDIATAVWSFATRTLTALAGQPATDIAAAVWNALTSGMNTVGSIGKKLAGWVLGSDSKVILSADAQTGVTIPNVSTVTSVANDVGITQAAADKVWNTATKVVTQVNGNVTGNIAGSVGSVAGDVAGKVLGGGSGTITGTGVQAQLPTDAIGSAQLADSATAEIAGMILANPSNKLVTDGSGRVSVYANADKTGYSLTSEEEAAIAAAIWDLATTGHVGAGTFGAQLKTVVDAILEDTGTTLDTLLKDIQGTGFVKDTDSLVNIAHTGLGGGTIKDVQDGIANLATETGALETHLDTIEEKLDTDIAVDLDIQSTLDDASTGIIAINDKVDVIDNNMDAIVAKLPSGQISDVTLDSVIDGTTLSTIYEYVMAMVNGRYRINTPSAGQITFYKRNGTTPLFVVSVSDTERVMV